MDSSCVGRRTRSRTESYLYSLLNISKGISVEEQSESRRKRQKKRDSIRSGNSSPPPAKAKRRRGTASTDDSLEFVGIVCPEGKPDNKHVDNVASPSLIAPSLESRSPDRDRVCDLTLDDDDDVYVGNFPKEKEHVDDYNVDKVVDDSDLRGEEKTSAPVISEADEVMSLSSSSGEDCSEEEESGSDSSVDGSDEDAESDYTEEESSDSSYNESSESEFDCSEDDEVCGGGARDTCQSRKKSTSGKAYTREKPKSVRKKSNSDVVKLLAKSIWERTKIFDEDISSGDEAAEVGSREDHVVRESSSEKVYEQKGERTRLHREKNKSHSNNVTDRRGNPFSEEGECFDGGEKPWVSPPLNLRFGCEEEPEPIEKTEAEKEIDGLWEEMAFVLTSEGVNSSTIKKRAVSCSNGNHDFVLDEEIGLKCRYCSYVSVEIRDISPAMDKYRPNANEKTACSDKKGEPLLNKGIDFEALDRSDDVASLKDTEGTVWEYIPGIKATLYPHQQEGFEFIWKNLAGTTNLEELKSSVVKESGGCVISHSPGTGKTRLTIVFLQSYLEQFPDSHPVVIAPKAIMQTWEEEFRKWNSNIPFFNMNNKKFSGDESQSAVALIKGSKQCKNDQEAVRMVKLYSWRTKKSVLGVSYHLYKKLAQNKEFKRMLLELPGLLVLDEGHTPRNKKSRIWKALSEVKTGKRIILSGTPFQNNFKELSTVLCLARPDYTEMITSRLHDLSKLSQEGINGRFDEEIRLEELKDMIAPFVHVHKGNILRENLPGRRDCVVVLNPTFQQTIVLSRIEQPQVTFELEHKFSAVSVHPSLFLCCNVTTREKLLIGPKRLDNLEKIRLDSKEGVKTRFLIELIRFSQTVKEKVLVFSQYLQTLELVRDQLSAVFGWAERREILYMHGELDQSYRQQMIHNFNEPDSESKVLLASTRACSEGICLVGASRVVLLDVVWNPSVEKQAISRAYRIGQKRVVYTYHLMVKDASEWEKYCTQTKKHRISEKVFSPTNEKDKLINNEDVSEDKILDEMVRHEKLKDMFEKILYTAQDPKESDLLINIL
ncbi:unnamed protein product [Thlaspi arvense]|uniref:Uncharacterized protein n=1 Tax=Thlaspi arvense TaxID=13288 RepID=A0AAU9S0A6_THLAR|nr:unnamed protein product [Thlaspi arvense]